MTLLMWGFMNVPTAFALAEMAPLQLLLLRTAIAVLILAPLARLRDGLLLPLPGDRITAALMGLSGVFFNNVFFFNAMKRTSLTNVAILFATSPFITAVLARIFLGERLTLRRVLGIVIALAGAVSLLCKGDLSLLADLKMNTGDLLELGAAFTISVMTILGRRIKKTPPITVTLCVMFTSFVATALTITVTGTPLNFALSNRAIFGVVYVGVFASAGAYMFQQMSIQRIGAGATGAFLNGSPALAIFGAVVFMGETISPVQIISAAVIFLGIFLNAGGARKA
jgi:drug/metabolite transporter (DMT)-like permease